MTMDQQHSAAASHQGHPPAHHLLHHGGAASSLKQRAGALKVLELAQQQQQSSQQSQMQPHPLDHHTQRHDTAPSPAMASPASSSGGSNHNHSAPLHSPKPNQVANVILYGIPIVSLFIEGQERLCLAQISNTLLKQFSYNEIHNRRVALGITCVQCTPVQLEILRRAGAMPVSSRRCGMITRREAERLCKSFLGDNAPPRLPDDFAFSVHHECAWGCCGSFLPARYNSSRAKCIKCSYCGLFFSPNKFIFHSHRVAPSDKYVQPDAANFNSWRRHMRLSGVPPEEVIHAWEDVKAMFNGGTRKRLMSASPSSHILASAASSGGSSANIARLAAGIPSPKRIKESPLRSPGPHHVQPAPLKKQQLAAASTASNVSTATASAAQPGVSIAGGGGGGGGHHHQLPFSRSFMMDYMWHNAQTTAAAKHHQQQQQQANAPSAAFPFPTYALPWLKPGAGTRLLFNNNNNQNNNNNNVIQPVPANTPSPGGHEETDAKPSVPLLQSLYSHSAFKPVLQTTAASPSVSAAATGLLLRHHHHQQQQQQQPQQHHHHHGHSQQQSAHPSHPQQQQLLQQQHQHQLHQHQQLLVHRHQSNPSLLLLPPVQMSPTAPAAVSPHTPASPPIKAYSDDDEDLVDAHSVKEDDDEMVDIESTDEPPTTPATTVSRDPLHNHSQLHHHHHHHRRHSLLGANVSGAGPLHIPTRPPKHESCVDTAAVANDAVSEDDDESNANPEPGDDFDHPTKQSDSDDMSPRIQVHHGTDGSTSRSPSGGCSPTAMATADAVRGQRCVSPGANEDQDEMADQAGRLMVWPSGGALKREDSITRPSSSPTPRSVSRTPSPLPNGHHHLAAHQQMASIDPYLLEAAAAPPLFGRHPNTHHHHLHHHHPPVASHPGQMSPAPADLYHSPIVRIRRRSPIGSPSPTVHAPTPPSPSGPPSHHQLHHLHHHHQQQQQQQLQHAATHHHYPSTTANHTQHGAGHSSTELSAPQSSSSTSPIAADFWSVARLSLDRAAAAAAAAAAAGAGPTPALANHSPVSLGSSGGASADATQLGRIPFYRTDITKHFQVFRSHHGEAAAGHGHGIG